MNPSFVRIQTETFDVGRETEALKGGDSALGACVVFVGYVRDLGPESAALQALELEHYPGMTERSFHALIEQARARFDLGAVRIIHRVGRLALNDPIVYVGVASAHRHAAFEACEFLMDQLKTSVPLWKKQHLEQGSQWVAFKDSDELAAARWVKEGEARQPKP